MAYRLRLPDFYRFGIINDYGICKDFSRVGEVNMGHQIIKQPNGKFCLFSSIVDNVIAFDCTAQDIIDIQIEVESERIKAKVSGIVEALERGEKPYHQFTMSYSEMMKFIQRTHGKKVREETQSAIETEGS